ncbi:MAG: serine/threonine protein kinase, partial [Acidimicrobiales bacterium]|nr:serine/threonine protein kinase [Acidimicrobiales bacterium]
MSEQGPTVFNDRYELHRKLARGGMSDVYLARDQLLDRPVAVKVLFPEYAREATFVERFRREAIAAARLAHPSIVSIFDTYSGDGTEAIVMELVDGRTLRQELDRRHHLPPAEAVRIGVAVADALDVAHQSRLVHRDIKPANILVETGDDGRLRPVLMDFGIAR